MLNQAHMLSLTEVRIVSGRGRKKWGNGDGTASVDNPVMQNRHATVRLLGEISHDNKIEERKYEKRECIISYCIV